VPQVVGPGSEIKVRLELANVGNAALQDATIDLPFGASVLQPIRWQATTGRVRETDKGLTWRPGVLVAGADAVLLVDAVVSAAALPDSEITLQAALRGLDGVATSNEIVITLPWTLLPAAGGDMQHCGSPDPAP
jgi:hypothetical protein